MMRTMIGKVTEEEKNEILCLYERKLGIEELTATLESDLLTKEGKENLQDKMLSELGKTQLKLQAWWDDMYEKYQWEQAEGHQWNIDFETCNIYLSQI